MLFEFRILTILTAYVNFTGQAKTKIRITSFA